MEPIEESMTLSPKESIVNILGRLFNNGHISGDELAMMQMELVARNPAPEPESNGMLTDTLLQQLVNRMREADKNHKTDPQGLRTWGSAGSPLHGSNPYTIPASGSIGVGKSSLDSSITRYPPSSTYEYESERGLYGYIDANKLTDFLKDESI